MKGTKATATKSKKKAAKPWITMRVDHIEIDDDDFHLHGEKLVIRYRDADGPMRALSAIQHTKELDMTERLENRLNENQSKRDGVPPPPPPFRSPPKEDGDVQG